jgi:putative FmdB family regulatory protein
MPIYEYRCKSCSRRFSVLVGVVASSDAVACPRCASTDAARMISRFARVRSEDEIMDGLADSSDLSNVDENDPGSVARFMRKMGSEMGEDLGDDFEEAMAEEMGAADSEGGGEPALGDMP